MKKVVKPEVFTEPARKIRVYGDADVVVVGGGPAGVSAAVSAARNGARTILMERYGCLGGMATGGLVLLIPHLSNGSTRLQIAGLCKEMIDRLDARNGAVHPLLEELGSTDPKLIRFWLDQSRRACVVEGTIRMSAYVDPEMLKCVLNDMVREAGVKILLHSWFSTAVMDKDKIRGIVFESKSGRQAVLANVIVDATGDGDVFASAGCEFDGTIDPNVRTSNLALLFRIGNVDVKSFLRFRNTEPSRYEELLKQLQELGGFTTYYRTSQDDVMWCDNKFPGRNALNVEDLTFVEMSGRERMLISRDFLRKYMPGFKRSFILDTASQIGTRGSRRLKGKYIVTGEDISAGKPYQDTIGICPPMTHNTSLEHPDIYIPYRCLLPQHVSNLIVAGRCFSSDVRANNAINWIPHCIVMGQAAGTAAALAALGSISPDSIDIAQLQDRLIRQHVPLPVNGKSIA